MQGGNSAAGGAHLRAAAPLHFGEHPGADAAAAGAAVVQLQLLQRRLLRLSIQHGGALALAQPLEQQAACRQWVGCKDKREGR